MEILCRRDPSNNALVVFVTDTIHHNKIKAWKNDGTYEYVPLEYYHVTAPLSASDERILCERFVAATNAAGIVKIRQRLPRTNRPLPNLLKSEGDVPAGTTILTGATEPPVKARGNSKKPTAQVESVAQATPGDVMHEIQKLGAEFNARLEALMGKLAPKQD